jgi:hypothetical protein
MKGNTVARTLKTRLTEEGLKRVIKRSSIYNDRFIAEFSADELERLIQIEPINMSRGGRVIAKKSRRRQNYLARVKKEIHILICTNDKKYATLRRQFTQRKITDRTRHNDRRGHRRLHRVKCCDAHAVCRGCLIHKESPARPIIVWSPNSTVISPSIT